MSDYLKILNKWAEYTEYDPDQRKFNLLSVNYHWHKVGDIMQMLINEYDGSGLLSIIYAKKQFERVMKESTIKVWDFLTESNVCCAEKQMFDMFNDKDFKQAEARFYKKMNNIYAKIVQDKLLGEDKDSNDKIMESFEKVAETIKKCRIEMFRKGGLIKKEDINNISAKLHCFNTFTECLLEIEKAQDGLYFCFIKANDSFHCFFSLMLKSNGTILSLNDRLNEEYIGQYAMPRNHRFVEGKAYDIFPYDYIFNYSDYDHKGYATHYEIKEEKYNIYEIGMEAFMPIIVCMLLFIYKVSDKELKLPMCYVDSLLPCQRKVLESTALMPIENSEIALLHDNVNLEFDAQKVFTGEYAREFNWEHNRNKDYRLSETGHFAENENIFVKMYGKGFKVDTNALLTKSNVACLTDKTKDMYAEGYIYTPEYIGTETRMRKQIYFEIRKQLADYVNQKIYEEWVSFGKTQAVKEWYVKALNDNKLFLYEVMAEFERRNAESIENNNRTLWRMEYKGISLDITYSEGKNYPTDNPSEYLHVTKDRSFNYYDEDNFVKCNVWFSFSPSNWETLEFLTGVELPKIVKGWNRLGHNVSGNANLSSCDYVEKIGTPFEDWTAKRNKQYENIYYYDIYYNFSFCFGFSKSNWKKIKKELKQ